MHLKAHYVNFKCILQQTKEQLHGTYSPSAASSSSGSQISCLSWNLISNNAIYTNPPLHSILPSLHLQRPFIQVSPFIFIFAPRCRFQRRGTAAARLPGLWVRIPPGTWTSVSSECSCCQVEVSASGWSLVQINRNKCGVSERDRVASTVRRFWPTRGCGAMAKKKNSFASSRVFFQSYVQTSKCIYFLARHIPRVSYRSYFYISK